MRGLLLGGLATYRETTEDRFHRYDRRDHCSGPEHKLVPYVNRFNSTRRVGEARERFGGAFDRAAEEFDRAVVVTLTTDPSRFDGLLSATESLMDDVNRLKSWLGTDSRLGSRPPSVVVLEFTDSGVPHVHVVLFGVSWVVPHAVLSAYWAGSRDRGEVVWFDRLSSRGEGGRWRWANREHGHAHPDGDVAGRSPRSYLSKSLDALDGLAGASPEAVRGASQALRRADGMDAPGEGMEGVSGGESDAERPVTDGGRDGPTEALARGREWWKLALYWATDTRLFTCSPSLKESDGDGGLPHVPRYEYVGTARYGEHPGHVRERAVVVARGGGRVTPGSGGPPDPPDPPGGTA